MITLIYNTQVLMRPYNFFHGRIFINLHLKENHCFRYKETETFVKLSNQKCR